MAIGVVPGPARLNAIRLLGLDVDGVLTDGRLWYGPEGELFKGFHVHDGLGIKRAQEAGIEIVVISARASAMVSRRLDDLGVRTRIQGCEDKGAALAQLRAQRQLPESAVAFAGDDLPDLAAFAVAGLRIAVANAQPQVLAAAHWVTAKAGGHGAVREVCEALIAAHTSAGAPP